MKLPFSQEEIAEVVRNNLGFRTFLEQLPLEQQQQIKGIIALDPHVLMESVKLLPEALRNQTLQTINNIVSVPDKALKLLESCRFFEARELLEESIQLYTNRPPSQNEGLDAAVDFVSQRVLSLYYDLLATVESELGKTERAGHYHHVALQLGEQLNDDATRAKALSGMGVYFWEHRVNFYWCFDI